MDHLNITTEFVDLPEARRRLPKVREHVASIMQLNAEAHRIQAAVRKHPDSELSEDEEREIRQQLGNIEVLFHAELKALNELGAYLKDPTTGLIDFYTWRDSTMAFLCWRYGEADIHYWHGLDEGFSGRKPLADGTAEN